MIESGENNNNCFTTSTTTTKSEKGEEKISSSKASCAICLELVNNRGEIGCQHEFCFDCILRWSEVTNTCPLCKKSFLSITEIQPSSSLYSFSAKKRVVTVEPKTQVNNSNEDGGEMVETVEELIIGNSNWYNQLTGELELQQIREERARGYDFTDGFVVPDEDSIEYGPESSPEKNDSQDSNYKLLRSNLNDDLESRWRQRECRYRIARNRRAWERKLNRRHQNSNIGKRKVKKKFRRLRRAMSSDDSNSNSDDNYVKVPSIEEEKKTKDCFGLQLSKISFLTSDSESGIDPAMEKIKIDHSKKSNYFQNFEFSSSPTPQKFQNSSYQSEETKLSKKKQKFGRHLKLGSGRKRPLKRLKRRDSNNSSPKNTNFLSFLRSEGVDETKTTRIPLSLKNSNLNSEEVVPNSPFLLPKKKRSESNDSFHGIAISREGKRKQLVMNAYNSSTILSRFKFTKTIPESPECFKFQN
eukprot:g3172.t1